MDDPLFLGLALAFCVCVILLALAYGIVGLLNRLFPLEDKHAQSRRDRATRGRTRVARHVRDHRSHRVRDHRDVVRLVGDRPADRTGDLAGGAGLPGDEREHQRGT